jgi:L-threonylcarbamoyladenylate synthase
MQDDVKKAADILHNGGIILYPTDTIWGIGCDATNQNAVQRVYELKQRSDSKAMLVLLNNENKLSGYVSEVPETAWQLIEVNDRPMTIIYPGAKNLAPNLIASDGSVGIRIVRDEFCEKLIAILKKPIVSTSANISGESAPQLFDQISDKIKSGVDYIVQWRQDDQVSRPASSIIKIFSDGHFKIIRK